MDDITQQIIEDIRRLEENNSQVKTVRQRVIDKLAVTFDSMIFNPDGKASDLEAKMTLTNTLLKALTDSEKQCHDVVKVRQKLSAEKAEKDNTAMISATIAEFIKKVNPATRINTKPVSKEELESTIDEIVITEDFDIPPGELEFGVSERIKDVDIITD